MKTTETQLLLVEDNEDDVFLMQRAFEKSKLTLPMRVICDGQEALDFLKGAGQYSDRHEYPLPAAIFLDLKLPYIHGFEILKWIRQDAATRNIPVYVLTSSLEERDRRQAIELGAQDYLVKPPSAQMLVSVAALLGIPGAASVPMPSSVVAA